MTFGVVSKKNIESKLIFFTENTNRANKTKWYILQCSGEAKVFKTTMETFFAFVNYEFIFDPEGNQEITNFFAVGVFFLVTQGQSCIKLRSYYGSQIMKDHELCPISYRLLQPLIKGPDPEMMSQPIK